jgi:hypothetical protein
MTESLMQAALIAPGESAEGARVRLRNAGVIDGLPVDVPTREQVSQFCLGAGIEPAGALAAETSTGGRPAFTAFDVAVCALLAGCEPAHLPLLSAAARAVAEPPIDLAAALGSGVGFSLTLVVSGPNVRRLGIDAGWGGCSGAAWPNAAIARALSLLLRNAARASGGPEAARGVAPGLCLAEDDGASPWPPLSTERSAPFRSCFQTAPARMRSCRRWPARCRSPGS